jgi:hypothetical protein
MRLQMATAFLAIVISGILSTPTWAQGEVKATRGNIQTLSVEELTRFGWQSGDSPKIVERRVAMEGTMWPPLSPPAVALFEAPTPIGQRLCRRISYRLPLRWRDQDLFYSELNAGNVASINDNSQLEVTQFPMMIVGLTIAPNCSGAYDQPFATIPPSYELEAITALQMLDDVRENAKQGQAIGPFLKCSTRSGPNRCASTPQQSLVELSIEQVWNIKQGYTPNSYEFWIGTPGQLVWEVTIVFHDDKRPSSVSMTSLIPHPF